MISISRKVVEEFYEKEWQEMISEACRKFLIELTCKEYRLNEMPKLSFTKEKELRPNALGKI
ncbi:MAG: hypothetical protein HYY52_05260 [Candidatus Melainabacteria bacterium]|nr:hypothetical protein [Candidatus Melainabacteria bacterium]